MKREYGQVQDDFGRLRDKMRRHFQKNVVDDFFRKPHAELEGKSPARAVHAGQTAKVEAIIERMTPR